MIKRIHPSPIRENVIAVNDELVKKIEKSKQTINLLDIGCGSWSYVLTHRPKNLEWHGIDVVERDNNGKKTIATKIGSVDNIPYPDNYFDIVLANQSMEHWYEYGVTFNAGITEIGRVLKIGGKAHINVPIHFHGHPYFVQGKLQQIKKQFTQFKIIRFQKKENNSKIPFYGWKEKFHKEVVKNKESYMLDIIVEKTKKIEQTTKQQQLNKQFKKRMLKLPHRLREFRFLFSYLPPWLAIDSMIRSVCNKQRKKTFVVGTDELNWSIGKDIKHTKRFIKQITPLTNNPFTAKFIIFPWYTSITKLKYLPLLLLAKLTNKKIIATITNDCVIKSQTYHQVKKWVDVWISPNSKITSFLQKRRQAVVELPFYVDHAIFKKTTTDYKKKYHLPTDKLLIGSFQRDSLGADLTQPKWQKGPDMLINICKQLPKNSFVLVLAGPRRHYLINKCKEENIPYRFIGNDRPHQTGKDDVHINNLNEKIINELYNAIDLYVVSSTSEGGPKAIMEAALTKTAIISTNVGLAKDFLHKDLIYTNHITISKKIPQIINNQTYINYNYNQAKKRLAEENYTKTYQQVFWCL